MSFDSWERKKLIDVTIKIGSGATPRGGSKSYKNEGIPFIRSQNIYNCEFNPSGLVYIDDDQANKLSNVEIEEDDVLLNITGDSVARCTIVPTKYIGGRVNQHVSIIRTDKSKLIPSFLKYYLVDPKMQNLMLSWAQSGGTRAALTKGMIESLEISLPSITEQKVIADILSSLDEKIEINNQINKKLEEMAQAIFKQWFVDFEFPNENGEPYKSSGGEMVESELGMIPKGWTITTLSKYGKLQMGLSPKSNTYNEEGIGIPLLNGAADFSGKLITPNKYTTDPKRICKENDLVFCIRATIGNITYADKQYCLGRGVASITPLHETYSEYIYYNLKRKMDELISKATGSVILGLSKPDINEMKIVVPNEGILLNFHKIVSKFHKTTRNNDIQNLRLSNIRDTLLPKLMSGEIRVPVEEEK